MNTYTFLFPLPPYNLPKPAKAPKGLSQDF